MDFNNFLDFKNTKVIAIDRDIESEKIANQLKDTTMDPEKRSLIQLKLTDGIKYTKKTEKLFEALMGKKAEKRFNKLKSDNRLISELHFWDKLFGLTYEEAKQNYLGEVGR